MPYEKAREELWARLLAGRVTEVFVFGAVDRSTLGTYLPQTLGLEPIVCDAYKYMRDGALRSYAELVELARQLAAQKCWIAEGVVPVWAAAFMESAEAILQFEVSPRDAMRADPPPNPAALVVGGARRLAWWIKRSRASGGELQVALGAQSWRIRRTNPVADLAGFALERFPEKVIRVTTWEQRQELSKVRALPRGDAEV